MVSARAKRILRRIGWAYVCFHMAVFLVVQLFDDSWRWSIDDFFAELVVGFILYPALIPALILCGGVHGGGMRERRGTD